MGDSDKLQKQRARSWQQWRDTPWHAKDSMEWIYERPEGDIVVYARCKEEAIEAIRGAGFTVIDEKKMRIGAKVLLDQIVNTEPKAIE